MLFIIFFLLSLTAFSPFAAYGETLQPFEPNDPYFFYNAASDKFKNYPGEWYLENKIPASGIDGITSSGVDAGLRGAWNLGYTGKGVVIGILDNGVEGSHPDLKDNYSADLSRTFLQGSILKDQGPVLLSNNHGTAVAGVAAARGANGIGGTGAAPYAKIAGLRVLDSRSTRADYFNAYMWKSGVEYDEGTDKFKIVSSPEIQIKNNSYGSRAVFNTPNSNNIRALQATAINDVIHVFSAGNYRGSAREDSNKASPKNLSSVIAVAALGSDGKFSSYSNYGANVFVTAPSSTSGGFGITTTDRAGENFGYNHYSEDKNPSGKTSEDFPDYDYTSTFGGTSSAAPLVSGILALGKEANKYMDVRLAKHVLVQTSTRVDPDDKSATGGWVKNGAGNWFNPNYGFGLVNAAKFVETVKKSSYMTAQTSYATGLQTVNEKIQYLNDSGTGGTSKQLAITNVQIPDSIRQSLEGVEVYLNFTHSNRGDLTAGITSPYTTKSRLFNATTNLASAKQDTKSVTDFEWTFLTNAFWGEDPLGGKDKTTGTWTITMGDMVDRDASLLGTWNSYKFTLLMGRLVFLDGKTTVQTENIKTRQLQILNSNTTFSNPAGKTVEVNEVVEVADGELNVNGRISLIRAADDNDSEDGLFVVTGGTVSGTGIIDAPYGFLHLGGTIKPGNSIGTLTINGDYYQGPQGKLLIEVASPTSNDLLAINGSAYLSGILQTSWQGGYVPALLTRFGTILTASDGITGQFTKLLTNITPTVMFKPKYDIPDQIYLVVERDYANDSLPLTTNQRSVGMMLNAVANTSRGLSGDLNTVLSSIDALTSNFQVAAALDQIAPKGDVAISGMAVSGSTFQAGNIANRLSELRSGARGFSFTGFRYDEENLFGRIDRLPVMLASSSSVATDIQPALPDDNWGVFVRGNAVIGDQRGTADRIGYNFTSTGVTMGIDYRFSRSAIGGIMLGVNTARARLDDAGSNVKMDGASLGLYGTYYRSGFFLDGQLSYGLNKYDDTRRIVFPGIDRTATSSPRGEIFSAYGGTGYDLQFGRWTVTPSASLQYTRLAVDDYTEAGADSLNLLVERRTTASVQGNLGVKLAYEWDTAIARIMPNIHASYMHEFSSDSQAVVAQLAQIGIPFTVQTASSERNMLMPGLGLMSDFKNGMFLYLNYDAQIGQNSYLAHSIYAGMKITF